MPEKSPADHKTARPGYEFTVKGKKYRLPPPPETAGKRIPGEVTYAAVMEPDNNMAQLRLALATLEASNPPGAAMAALKTLSTDDMLEHVGKWMQESSGESPGSSE